MAKSKTADEPEVDELAAPEVQLNPNYSYGPPVLINVSTTSPANTAGAVNVNIAGGKNMVPSPPAATVTVPGGSPNEEIVTMYTPTLASISPATVVHGVADAVVTCTGTNFRSSAGGAVGTVVTNGGVDMATTYVSPTSVTYVMPHSTAAVGTVSVNVKNAGIASATPRTFTYT